MHDRNGTPLKKGDKIMIEYIITGIISGEGYCNISARSVLGRKPDGEREYFSGNTAVVLLVEKK